MTWVSNRWTAVAPCATDAPRDLTRLIADFKTDWPWEFAGAHEGQSVAGSIVRKDVQAGPSGYPERKLHTNRLLDGGPRGFDVKRMA